MKTLGGKAFLPFALRREGGRGGHCMPVCAYCMMSVCVVAYRL